ncbi:HAD-IB family phosphatase [Tautonia plasticadhaerens]|uniref:phosphoserine phosphatase n=1 Tax=Tautonia plasticadhaerens TaxID=2527974 RepID=A0A518HCS0_9BACT|nr:HAD-IB family phosphatase [Tautonia plasticadhaerens]QDV38668.1 2-hydroxy-3-keto-5-methylthiopentenyl-1-phosphate phosphatase [Tautonia plasticadhaerens]
MAGAKFRSVLVTDFDGTLTDQDFYKLVRERLVPPGTPDFWASYREGTLTHFEALRAYFASARPDEEALVGMVDEMGLEPELPEAVELLNRAGWKVVVVSSGCHWYIDRLLAKAGVALEVHANPGGIEGGRLAMHWPAGTSYPSKQTGVSKPAVVTSFLEEGRAVAYAGDGDTDAEAAVLVPAHRRFARQDLAEALRGRGEEFRPFDRWIEVARALAEGPAS